MPPMPPPPGIAGAPPPSFFGSSATMASVVTRRPATDAASCKRCANDLGRVDDAGFDHVDIGFALRVEAEVPSLDSRQLADNDGAFDTGVFDDLTDRSLQRLKHDVDAGLDVRFRP